MARCSSDSDLCILQDSSGSPGGTPREFKKAVSERKTSEGTMIWAPKTNGGKIPYIPLTSLNRPVSSPTVDELKEMVRYPQSPI